MDETLEQLAQALEARDAWSRIVDELLDALRQLRERDRVVLYPREST